MSLNITNTFIAHQDALAEDVNQNFQDVQTWGNNLEAELSTVIFPNQDLIRQASAPISQVQSTTVSRFTISGIENEEMGFIDCICGGNVGAIDRASVNYNFSYYRTGGTVFFSSSGAFGTSGGGTANNIVITALNSGGDIVIQTQLGGFGAGSFVGNLFITAGKSTSGLIIST